MERLVLSLVAKFQGTKYLFKKNINCKIEFLFFRIFRSTLLVQAPSVGSGTILKAILHSSFQAQLLIDWFYEVFCF
jgi:hypothetical protein